jgi:hypothetical protein
MDAQDDVPDRAPDFPGWFANRGGDRRVIVDEGSIQEHDSHYDALGVQIRYPHAKKIRSPP